MSVKQYTKVEYQIISVTRGSNYMCRILITFIIIISRICDMSGDVYGLKFRGLLAALLATLIRHDTRSNQLDITDFLNVCRLWRYAIYLIFNRLLFDVIWYICVIPLFRTITITIAVCMPRILYVTCWRSFQTESKIVDLMSIGFNYYGFI